MEKTLGNSIFHWRIFLWLVECAKATILPWLVITYLFLRYFMQEALRYRYHFSKVFQIEKELHEHNKMCLCHDHFIKQHKIISRLKMLEE